jgi:Divergent InlB B-repeat domain
MVQQKIHRTITTILLIFLALLTTNTIVEVRAKNNAFMATISPVEVSVNQINTFSVTVTNTGESSLGSTSISIPAGFTVSQPITIVAPPSSWNYTWSPFAINLTAMGGGASIDQGQSVIFTFVATAPVSSGIYTWIAVATSGIGGGGQVLALNGTQPTVAVVSLITAPTISASPSMINQGQISLLSQFTGPSGGITPYTFQWLEAYNGATFSSIAGAVAEDYFFSPQISTATGTWSFRLSVTDSSIVPVAVTSNTVDVIVNPELAPPEVTATPNAVIQTQPSTLTSTQVTTGTPPYTYQWFQKAPGSDYATVGQNSASYTFPGSTTIGTWSFLLQVTDNTGASVTSTAIDVLVSSTPALTISVTQTAHGIITPGSTTVNSGGSQSFTISPDAGYQITDVLADGTSVGIVTSFAFVDVTADHALTATFSPVEYTLTVNIAGSGSVAKNPDQATYHYSDVVQLTAIPESGWKLSQWTGDLTGSINPSSISISGNRAVTAAFVISADSYFINVASSHGSPTPSTQVNTGSSLTASVISPEGDTNHRWICTGYCIDGGALISGTSYTFTNVQSDHTITFNWQEQYHLTADSPGGSTVGTGWYNIGTTVTVSVPSNTISSGSGIRQVFTGWIGDATGTTTTSNPITIDSPKTATATWKTQYQVTYATSGNTLQVTTPPTEWADPGSPATGTFPTSTTNLAGNIKTIFVNDNRPTDITEPITITGAYQTQYLVTFIQNGISSDASGTIVTIIGKSKTFQQLPNGTWMDAGNSIIFNYAATVESNETGKQYILTSTNFTSPLIINEPMTILANYEPQISSQGFALNTIAIAAILLAIPPSVAVPLLVKRRKGKKKITPIENEGGSISPSTVQMIEQGDDSTVFIIAAQIGHRIADVVIDNSIHLGAVRTYKFVNVTQNHTISAIFTKE